MQICIVLWDILVFISFDFVMFMCFYLNLIMLLIFLFPNVFYACLCVLCMFLGSIDALEGLWTY